MEDIERQVVAELDEVQISTAHDPLGKVLVSVSVVPQGFQE